MTQLCFFFFAPPAPPAPVAELPARPLTVYLVGCGRAKQRRSCRAKDLYTSNLFRAARRHAEQNGTTWRILSARYGVLSPERRVKPYELSIKSYRTEERAQWGTIAASSLNYEMRQICERYEVVVLAGEEYAAPICRRLEEWGIRCTRPLAGLPMGRRLQWLKEHAQ